MVWITTLGRKSGEWRRTPLLAVHEDGDPAKPWLVTGSNAGQAAMPGWVFNVRAHDEGTLEIEGTSVPVRFEEATGRGARPALRAAGRDLVGLPAVRAERRPRDPGLPRHPASLSVQLLGPSARG